MKLSRVVWGAWASVFFVFVVALSVLAFTGSASAINAGVFTFEGGTPAQVKQVTEILEASEWDWSWGSDKNPTTRVVFAEDTDGWNGYASYPSGDIFISASISGAYLNQTILHEAFHARVFYPFMRGYSEPLKESPALLNWIELIGNFQELDWLHAPIESMAEYDRITYDDPSSMTEPFANTKVHFVSEKLVRQWHNYWCYGIGTKPIPTKPSQMFVDVSSDDMELYFSSSTYAGVMQGYPDGSFKPSKPLTYRQVALVLQREGMSYDVSWLGRYTNVSRGVVRDSIPRLVWNSARWDEDLTRGQLSRLLLRSGA